MSITSRWRTLPPDPHASAVTSGAGTRTPVREVVLHPGECFIGNQDFRVVTLLGSCVSITLWHAGHRIGAMSHCLLATRESARVHKLDGRYGDEAVLMMLARMVQAGVDPGECVAKIFGGGNMFPHHASRESMHVGRRNGHSARQLLTAFGIPVVSSSLFGTGHRKMVFDIATGVVWLRHRPM